MRRRAFIRLLGGAAAAWPVVASAQQDGRMRRIGVLMSGAEADTELQARVKAFRQTLEQYGWSEGRNIHMDIRFSAIRSDEYQALAKEMVALQPDVIFGHTTPVVVALQRESRTVPIVFVNVSDPLGSGLVTSLAHPGGNITGLMLYEEGITGKWLALLKEIAPHLSRAAPSPADGLRAPLLCRGRRSHVLRDGRDRPESASGVLRRPHSARRQACRPSGTGANQVRNDRQSQDSEGARPRRAADAPRACRRGDRVM
jgi:hypothetical protein